MRIPLLAGRNFDQRDHADSPPVAIINEALAKRHFNDIDPLGKTIHIWGQERQVIGMLQDFGLLIVLCALLAMLVDLIFAPALLRVAYRKLAPTGSRARNSAPDAPSLTRPHEQH